MVQAIVNLNEFEDRVLAIVKGVYGLKNKSEAINLVITKFEEGFLEHQLRPEYKEELKKIAKGKFKAFSGVDDLRREIENVSA